MSVTFVEPDFSKYLYDRERVSTPDPLDRTSYDDATPILSSTLKVAASPISESSPFLRRVSFDTITTSAPCSVVSEAGYENCIGGSSYIPSSSSVFRSLTPPASVGNLMSAYTTTASSSAPEDGTNLKDYTKDKDVASFFVSSRHQDHKISFASRTFLFSLTSKHYSLEALKWLVSTLMEDGDELVCLKMHHSSELQDTAGRSDYQQEAEKLLDAIISIVDRNLKINIVVELGVGKVKAMALKTLLLYQPCLVIVGTSERAFGNIARVRYKKTVSSYLIARSPVPVIIVSPSRMMSRPSTPATSPQSELPPKGGARAAARRRRRSSTSSEGGITSGTFGSEDWPRGSYAYYASVEAAVEAEPMRRKSVEPNVTDMKHEQKEPEQLPKQGASRCSPERATDESLSPKSSSTPSTESPCISPTTTDGYKKALKWGWKLTPSFLIPRSYRRNSS
jgi:hypothetical protein